MVFTRRVSSRIETTLAACQGDAFGTLVTVLPLFPPWVTVGVVSVHLPESWFVVLHESKPAHPFSGLPEIEMWDQQARRPAMLGCQRLAIVLPYDQRFPIE